MRRQSGDQARPDKARQGGGGLNIWLDGTFIFIFIKLSKVKLS